MRIEWMDALARRWERRLERVRHELATDQLLGQVLQLEECISELRAEMESAAADKPTTKNT